MAKSTKVSTQKKPTRRTSPKKSAASKPLGRSPKEPQPVEVHYERMRPDQIRRAREACPVVYIPLGTLEWHGLHDPVGLDGLKADALAVRCARAGGGLVFPPLYFGELIEMFEEYQQSIAHHMGLDPGNFSAGYMGCTVADQIQRYQNLMLHILFEATSLGFKVIVFAAGHYPLLEYARAAGRVFYHHCNRSTSIEKIPATFVFSDYELVQDVFPEAPDHAGFWETSLQMALVPGLVDLKTLPEDEKELIGVLGTKRPVRDSNAEYGERAVHLIVERVTRAVHERLRQPEKFHPR